MNWRDSIWVSDSVTQWAFPMRKLRSVSFPIQRTRVTRVTRDVLNFEWQTVARQGFEQLFGAVNRLECAHTVIIF